MAVNPEYYDRQAANQLKKVHSETTKRALAEKKAAALDEKALRADRAAASTKSEATRRSKLREAESARRSAADQRAKAAAATKAAGDAQTKANEYRAKADAERTRRSKKAREEAERQGREAERRVRREARTQANRDAEVRRDIGELQTRTDELEKRIAASRAHAPSRITVLLMAGTPEGGEAALRLDRESREIEAKVRAGRYRDQISLVNTQATRINDIVDALNRHTPDVVHFSGHGDSGALLFDGPDGTPRALLGEHLALLLQAAPRPIRMVVFNACESAKHAASATEFADFAIGMERSIGDESAKEWAGQFYGSLAAGATVDLAFRQAVAHATALAASSAPLGEPQLHAAAGADAEATVLVNPDTP
jgi:hypothetical protein